MTPPSTATTVRIRIDTTMITKYCKQQKTSQCYTFTLTLIPKLDLQLTNQLRTSIRRPFFSWVPPQHPTNVMRKMKSPAIIISDGVAISNI